MSQKLKKDKEDDEDTEVLSAGEVNTTANSVIKKMVNDIASEALSKAFDGVDEDDEDEENVATVKKSKKKVVKADSDDDGETIKKSKKSKVDDEEDEDQPITASTLTKFGDNLVKAIGDGNKELIKALTKGSGGEAEGEEDEDEEGETVKKSKKKDVDLKPEELVKTTITELFKGLGIDLEKPSMRKSYVVTDKGALVKSGGEAPDDSVTIDIDEISMDEWNALPEETRKAITSQEMRRHMTPK